MSLKEFMKPSRMCFPKWYEERKNMVGLLTLDSRIYNYGGFLQEMALQDAIKNLGYECEVIDYDISQELNTFSLKRGINYFSLEKIKKKLNKKKPIPISSSVYDLILKRKKAFDEYRDNNLVLSRKLNSINLHSIDLPFEQLVCGSDQIWNPEYNIPAFFLNFGKRDCRRVIYAASIGRDYLSKLEKKTYSKLLEYPDFISVREESAQKLISSISNKNVELVLDPTLLHKQEYWMEKADDSSLNYKKYIFCYFLDINDEKVKSVNDFAKKNNFEIIAIPYLHNEMEEYSEKLNGKLISEVNPADFLNLIRYAEAVITDSFHATVFSIIFKKDFWCFGRNVGTYSMDTRLHTLLGYVEMQDRMIAPSDLNDKTHCTDVDIDLQNLKIKQNKSIAFLSNALETL